MKNRIATMLHVDFRRMFTQPLVWIMLGACLVMPVLILVTTTMMDGSVSVNPQTGEQTVVEGFDNVWQIIGSVSSAGGAMSVDMTAMCNVNLLYFFVAVLVCLFVSADFHSGYAKNLFTVRAKKSDYVLAKTAVCFVGGALMVLAFFVGSLVGGAIAGLPFDMVGFGMANLVMCLVAKVLLMAVFVPLFLVVAVAVKDKAWLSILLSLMVGMFLFMAIPLLSPLDAGVGHVLGCLAGGVLASVGFGAVSNAILKKTSLV